MATSLISSPGRLTLVCTACGATHSVYRSQVYGASPHYALPDSYKCAACSKKCKLGKQPGPRVVITCSGCGVTRELIPSQASRYQTPFFCKKCSVKAIKGTRALTSRTCSGCGKIKELPTKSLKRRVTTLCRECHLTTTSKPPTMVKVCPDCGSHRVVGRHQAVPEPRCMPCRIRGEGNPNWHDGVSRRGYSPLWGYTLKAKVYIRDRYRCQVCAKHKGRKNRFAVHHIDYDKENSSTNNLILLCDSCHGRTNSQRHYWTERFQLHLTARGF